MTKKKTTYLSPETELLVVRFEGNFCGTGSPDGTWDNSIKGGSNWGSSAYEGNDNPYGLE